MQILIAKPAASTFVWKLVCTTSVVLMIACTVYLVEPRPAYWVEWARSARSWIGAHSFAERRSRVLRWWRWRKKYARTKLNV